MISRDRSSRAVDVLGILFFSRTLHCGVASRVTWPFIEFHFSTETEVSEVESMSA